MYRLAIIAISFIPMPLLTAGELTVGFAERDCTPKADDPKKPVWLAGFGIGRPATGIHDSIMARGLVLADGDERIAMVCVDVVGLFRGFVEEVRAELPGYKYVLISSTHNHDGPDTMGIWGGSPFRSGIDPEYMKQLKAKIIALVKEADGKRTSAYAEIATVRLPDLLKDSRKPYVMHDELVCLRFRKPKSNAAIGIIMQWNCHPETMGSRNTEVSSDFVGPAVTALAKAQGCPVAYFSGTVGGLLSSLGVPVRDADNKLLADGTFAKTEQYGKNLAAAAHAALQNSTTLELTPFVSRSKVVHAPIANKTYQLAWLGGLLKRTAYVWDTAIALQDRPIARNLDTVVAIDTEVGYLKLGELEVVAVPGEIYSELVIGGVEDPAIAGADYPDAPIEPILYSALKSKHRMIIGLANDEIGYIIPKRQWDDKAPFCYGRDKPQYGEQNSLGAETAPILMKALREVIEGK